MRSHDRIFPTVSVRRGDGMIAVRRIECSRPGCTNPAEIVRSSRAAEPPEMIRATFQRRGWTVGRSPTKDVCPDCKSAGRATRPQHTKEEPMKPSERADALQAATTAAPPPRPPTFDERRIIFSKLEDTYLDDKRGYAPGWDDEKVARDLNCPRAWVEEIRATNFGPLKVDHSAEIADLGARLENLENALRALNRDYEAMETSHRHMAQHLRELGGRIKEAEKGHKTCATALKKLTGAQA